MPSLEGQTARLPSSVGCAPPKTWNGTCNTKTCFAFHYTTVYRQINCTCTPETTRRPVRCCCHPPTRWQRSCTGSVRFYHRTVYHREEETCLPETQIRKTEVRCKTGLIRRQTKPCDVRSCRQLVVDTYERVSGCQCIHVHLRAWRRCCCPKPSSRVVCERNTDVVRITKFYKLAPNGRCVKFVTRTTLRKVQSESARFFLLSMISVAKALSSFLQNAALLSTPRRAIS